MSYDNTEHILNLVKSRNLNTLFKYLSENECDPDIRNENGKSLIVLLKYDFFKCMEMTNILNLLIMKKINTNDYQTLFINCCKVKTRTYNDIIKLLLETNIIDVNYKDKNKNFALLCVYHSRNLEIFELLLNNTNIHNKNIILNAIRCTGEITKIQATMFKLLVKSGVDTNIHNQKDETPLISVCNSSQCNYSLIKILLENGADTNLKKLDNNKIPIDYIFEKCILKYDTYINIIKMLIYYGSDLPSGQIEHRDIRQLYLIMSEQYKKENELIIYSIRIPSYNDVNIEYDKRINDLILECIKYKEYTKIIKSKCINLLENDFNILKDICKEITKYLYP